MFVCDGGLFFVKLNFDQIILKIGIIVLVNTLLNKSSWIIWVGLKRTDT